MDSNDSRFADDVRYFSLLGADESHAESLARQVDGMMRMIPHLSHDRARELVKPFLYRAQRDE